jgi:hypothetical protein
MPSHTVTITLTINARSESAAFGIASGAAAHLADTFNDDGSLVRVDVGAPAHQRDAARVLRECARTISAMDARLLRLVGATAESPRGEVARALTAAERLSAV